MRLVSRTVIAAAAALSLLAGGAVVAQAALTQAPAEVQAGTYKLDPDHGKVTCRSITWASRPMSASS